MQRAHTGIDGQHKRHNTLHGQAIALGDGTKERTDRWWEAHLDSICVSLTLRAGAIELFLDTVGAQRTTKFSYAPLTPQGVEGRWQWSSLVAILGAARHVHPVARAACVR